jgi:isoquinoline 1-oxidoreductase beta subunit
LIIVGQRGKPNKVPRRILAHFITKNIKFSDIPFETPQFQYFAAFCTSTKWICLAKVLWTRWPKADPHLICRRQGHLKEARVQILIDKMEEVSGWKSRNKMKVTALQITVRTF